jgi:IS30 family transposase
VTESATDLPPSAAQLVRIIARQAPRRPVRQDRWVPGPGRLTLADREEISLGLGAGESFTMIAARLGKAVSTVSREVAASGGRGQYRAWRAHQRARYQARRPKDCKLADPALAATVTCWLTDWWSPVQISRRLRIEFPGDPMMRVSHETIYQALYVQGRGELRRELARCLRTGRGTNGLLRKYLPKGTDLPVHSADDTARIARSLNGRPRKTLDYITPSQKLSELLR